MESIKVICKRGELFFPEVAANAGRIMAWAPIGQHSEADLRYYQTRTNPEDKEAAELMAEYARCYGLKLSDLVRVKRQTIAMRRKAWARG